MFVKSNSCIFKSVPISFKPQEIRFGILARDLEAARSTENPECRVQGTAFFQTQSPCAGYFAFEFTLDIKWGSIWNKHTALNTPSTQTAPPPSPMPMLYFLHGVVKSIQDNRRGPFQFLAINSIPTMERNGSKNYSITPQFWLRPCTDLLSTVSFALQQSVLINNKYIKDNKNILFSPQLWVAFEAFLYKVRNKALRKKLGSAPVPGTGTQDTKMF